MDSLRMCVTKKLKSKIRENFENEDKLEQTVFLDKINHFIAKGIIELTDTSLSKVDAVRKRKFVVKKITMCFIEPKNPATWTSLNFLQSRVDNQNRPVLLDPLEEIVRRMAPYDAFRVIIKERIVPIVPVGFEFVSNFRDAVVKVGFERDHGTWSLVGLDHFFSLENVTLNMAWLDVGTILHELGHVLGMGHEHQNPIGRKIEWDEAKVYEWALQTNGWDQQTAYENIIETYDKNLLKATTYDPGSVMLYFFPAELTKNGIGSNQNFIMSVDDYKFLNTIMPNPRLTLHGIDEFWISIYGPQKGAFSKSSIVRGIAFGLIFLSLVIIIYWVGIRSSVRDYADLVEQFGVVDENEHEHDINLVHELSRPRENVKMHNIMETKSFRKSLPKPVNMQVVSYVDADAMVIKKKQQQRKKMFAENNNFIAHPRPNLPEII